MATANTTACASNNNKTIHQRVFFATHSPWSHPPRMYELPVSYLEEDKFITGTNISHFRSWFEGYKIWNRLFQILIKAKGMFEFGSTIKIHVCMAKWQLLASWRMSLGFPLFLVPATFETMQWIKVHSALNNICLIDSSRYVSVLGAFHNEKSKH